MLSCIIQQHRAKTLYDTDFGLPEQLNSNEWQQAEKIVNLLEPVQCVTKEQNLDWCMQIVSQGQW